MRILWFSVTPSLFNPHSNAHNGGGWIASLEQIVRTVPDIQLGIAFEFSDLGFRYEKDGVAYYPIQYRKEAVLQKLLKRDVVDAEKTSVYLKIIKDFKPDLIQIFGSENDFGLICERTDIPVIIHMQGCIPPYHNALFPVGMNSWDFLFSGGLTLRWRLIGLRSESGFRRRAEKEIHTIQSCRYFMGRTEWDRNLIELFHPDATYFHCEEALRDSFLNKSKVWQLNTSSKVTIVSVISNPWYKGQDLILKTAQLLKRFTQLDFEWRVYGIQNIRFYELKYKIKAKEVNVRIMGTASKDELVDALCDVTCYVHPSYIDNSPNSLCEAQLLGVPVLATHVGGISSLVVDGETGLLFPANAPYTLASLIKKLSRDKSLCERLSKNAREQALFRHNPETIRSSLISIYEEIIKDNRK
ncbi:glycosyltransferase family 4 protein [Coprobacter fastidiosus]|jgi:glycosyltransferase involved in cell wall biosynthesis|uniref:glycosyltransferase family 4 protein n=1 Tax=Coprobacter fastidiosus TaxID=1099853 RepID=UPI0022DF17DD|nr:glycosyltransferase [Coprobacter fastidiosus]